jgi:hypothetical protein
MLTLEKLKAMQPHSTIKSGTAYVQDYWDASKEMEVDFIAQRGGIHDWAIYYMPEGKGIPFCGNILNNGEKMHNRESIRKCVPCDDEAMKMYRD